MTPSRLADEHKESWLAPTPLARARVVERAGAIDFATLLSAGLALIVIGWTAIDRGAWALIPFVFLAVFLAAGPLAVNQGARPEYVDFAANLSMFVAMAVGAGLTGGASSPLAYLLPVGVALSSLRGIPLATIIGAAVTGLVFLVVSLLADFRAVIDDPLPMVAFQAGLISICAATVTLSGAEIGFRRIAILDPLTGLLNRQALETRFEELRQLAQLSDAPISLIAFDLDRFKQINDEYGHDVGDAVLRNVAYEVRKSLRKFELAYRIGGEEFLIVLPGIDEAQAELTAEQLRQAVQRARIEGKPGVSASFGVSGGRVEEIEFESLYRRADRALYEAKASGRGCVRSSRQLVASGR